ncbi:MAG: DUF2062 domain-containing protein, partial [Sphingomicrobium sp.]
ARWLKGHVPTRETIDQYRLLRPFAPHLRHPSLWQLNRRSVPRGVALGLFVGVIIPVLHTFIAAILAIPARANVGVAALLTLVVNPLTIPFMYVAAYRIGSWELHHDTTLVNPTDAERFSSELSRLLFWIHQASGPIAVGVLTIAAGAALIGYLVSSVAWRLWSGSRWRGRHSKA